MKANNFIKQIEEIKNQSSLDLSLGEDLSIALMNLISLEEHFMFSFMKTKDSKFLEHLEKIRELRKKLLERIVKKNDNSEKWCISKHLLAVSMRLTEVGTKYLHEGKLKEAKNSFNEAFDVYIMFWELNDYSKRSTKKISGAASKISELMKKILDCCKE